MVPDFPFPSIFMNGMVSAGHNVDEGGVVNFPVNVSNYVCRNNKKLTLLYIFTFFLFACLVITSIISWHMDKGTPRLKNVLTPNKNTQVTLLGTCFQSLPDSNLCADLESISLPVAAQPTPPSTFRTIDVLSGKYHKFESQVPDPSSQASTSTYDSHITQHTLTKDQSFGFHLLKIFATCNNYTVTKGWK